MLVNPLSQFRVGIGNHGAPDTWNLEQLYVISRVSVYQNAIWGLSYQAVYLHQQYHQSIS